MADDEQTRSPGADDEAEHGVDRRTFLKGASVLGAASALDAASAHAKLVTNPGINRVLTGPVSSLLGEIESVVSDTKPTFAIVLRRREDFLFVLVEGYNLVRQGQRLVRDIDGYAAYIVFTFEPQHLTEQAYLLPGQTPKKPGFSKALLAYPSRIAFSLPDGDSIPLSVGGLLHWAALDPSLPPSAAYNPDRLLIASDIHKTGPGGVGPIHIPPVTKPPRLTRPTDFETAIELPWRLAISPTSVGGVWSHPTDVRTGTDGWSELWHTRLAASSDEAAADGGVIRAVWSYDPRFDPSHAPANVDTPFITSLNPFDRWQIVNATSNFAYQGKGRADVTANKLWLSARGGFLDSVGIWDLEPKLGKVADLGEWKHLATLARDHYVKVVEKGFLFPFGHKVVLTTVTERLFEEVDGQIVATSRQVSFLVVREQVKSYDAADTFGVANNSRDLPFRSLTLKTLRTPDLDPKTSFVGSIPKNDCFVPYVSGAPFQWHFTGTDWNGNEVAFTAPGVFVIQDQALTPNPATSVRSTYNALQHERQCPCRAVHRLGGRVRRLAHPRRHQPLGPVDRVRRRRGHGPDERFEHRQRVCRRGSADLLPEPRPGGGDAQRRRAGLRRLAAAVEPDGLLPPDVRLRRLQLAGQPGQRVHGDRSATGPALNFNGGSSGGVITPNLALSGLSRSLGPVAGDLGNCSAARSTRPRCSATR